MEIKVKWDDCTNDEDPGWVYLDCGESWQPVSGAAGRDPEADEEDIAAEIGLGLDVVFVEE